MYILGFLNFRLKIRKLIRSGWLDFRTYQQLLTTFRNKVISTAFFVLSVVQITSLMCVFQSQFGPTSDPDKGQVSVRVQNIEVPN